MSRDPVAQLVLRLCSSTFQAAWTDEWHATHQQVGRAVLMHRGRLAFVAYLIAEWFDLFRTAWRTRSGDPYPITSGRLQRPPSQRKPRLSTLLNDFFTAWRRLIREPRAAAGSILLLTLAIGVTSAMFAIVDAFIVRPSPFRDPATLTQVTLRGEKDDYLRANFDTVKALRDAGVFEAIAPALLNANGQFDGPSGPVVKGGTAITPGTFAMLGVSPMLGREFEPGEGRAGNDNQVILSEPVWRELFDADPAIVGRTIEMNKESTVVVGVMPASFRFPIDGKGVWRPVDLDAPADGMAGKQMLLFARLQASMPSAEAERLATDAARTVAAEGSRIQFRDPSAGLLDDYSRESLTALAVGVGLVFVVLCANVTNLILARTSSRRQEFGVCAALGASRGRLLRQVFIENTVVGLCATALGLGLAYLLVSVAQNTLPTDLMWRTLNPLDLDLRAVLATSATGMVAVVLAGLPAAWLGTRTDVNASIRLSSRGGTDSPASRRLTRGLLIVEVAMAVALLAAAGLQVRSFMNLVNADRGLDSNRVLLARVTLPESAFVDAASQATTARLIADRVGALPGVERVTLASDVPPDSGGLHFGYEFQPLIDGAGVVPVDLMNSYAVAPDFFETFGITLREGRGFTIADDTDAVVLGEALAHRLFPDRPAVGERYSDGKRTRHVVGVATEIRNSITDPRQDFPEFYYPWYRVPAAGGAAGAPGQSTVRLGVRCAEPCASEASVRQAIESVSASLDVADLHLLSNDFLKQLERPKAAAVVAALFSGLALFASAAGLYGVLSYLVSRRRREFGIRAAMGANPAALHRSVMNDGVRVSLMGVALGITAGWTLSRWLGSVQFGVTFFDPITWTVVITAVMVAAVLSSWRPAREAMRANPASLLREQ